MTRARTLKQTIRARAARTGERYTTARRHVLASRAKHAAETPRPTSAPEMSSPPMESPASKRPGALGALTDANCRRRTGHGLDHWFAVLDAFGADAKGHTAAARHLHEAHEVPGWHAQGITVAYERARGLRAVNQRPDGTYEVSVSKVVAADVPAVVRAFSAPANRKRWLQASDRDLGRVLAAALDSATGKKFVTKPSGDARFRYRWGPTTIEISITARPNGKSSVAVSNLKLASAAMVEERRAAWRGALHRLKDLWTT